MDSAPYPHPVRHPIDPKVDCVFKALLGSEDNRALLIHFINAVLADDLPAPITEVEILNPYNEREAFSDKFAAAQVETERERWLEFFKEAALAEVERLKALLKQKDV
jgi:hypothetical protein